MAKLSENVPLSDYTTYKIGGPARYFAEAKKETDIAEILNEFESRVPNGKVFILGGGANVLFADDGYDGLVLKISLSEMELTENGIRAGAGTSLKDVVQFALENNLSGMEFIAGCPGSFGGAIRGNAGAFGGEMKDCITSVRSIIINAPKKIIERKNEGNMFGYRTSIFKTDAKNEIILSGEVRLVLENANSIKERMESNLNYRKEKHPMEWPSAGSTFKNISVQELSEEQKRKWKDKIKTDPIPVLPAAVLISEAGLIGKAIGGAKISEKHPNFFINAGNATAKDVKELIVFVKKTVKEKFKINLKEEIQIVNSN
ncbi:MAG: UDP-N-acetylmuramate dehydrogenase [Parcubacteria group bacterium]